jgi:hypothetical protein
MDKPKVTPKDFFLWVGAMLTFYVSVFSFISLIFDYINYSFPNVLNYYPSDPYSGSVSYEMASLLVLFPIYMLLMWIIRNDIKNDSSRSEIWARRWVIMLTLFIAGAALVIDLVTLIMYFFNGDITIGFSLKVLTVLLVASATFMHFVADLRGYWDKFPLRKRAVGSAVGVLVLVTIVAGFFIIGTPWQARLYRFDNQKVNDLTNIQWQIINYWQLKEKLPSTLADLNDSISGFVTPIDLQSNTPYIYEVTGKLAFKLCATFNAETQSASRATTEAMRVPIPMGPKGEFGLEQPNWSHGAGMTCFERTIDPERYPTFKNRQ